ncbi:recombinase family protein [Clostridium sp.]|uniref:recombinase family protein n=1 Tax=Clostridium sp. TaxID=1506 RepID=UPI001A4910D6|nr:recombinase family protein [Clostridium sp.]MBK5243261.1 recombinase family protein [Clostridium sp.]
MKVSEFISALEVDSYRVGSIRESELYNKRKDEDVKIGSYARISKGKKGDTSVIRQIESIEMFLEDMNCDPNELKTYKDEGISGTNMDRPDYNRMLFDIKNNRVNIIVVANIDRLGRDVVKLIELIYDTFMENNIVFVALDNMIVNTSEDRKRLIEYCLAAEDVARQTSIKIRNVMKGKMKKNILVTSQSPYGYERIKVPCNEGKYKERAIYIERKGNTPDVVKKIFELYVQGKGYGFIAKYLNNLNIPSPDKGEWQGNTIKYILTNPVYAGIIAQGRFRKNGFLNNGQDKKILKVEKAKWFVSDEKFKGIVSGDVFDLVQEKIKDNINKNVNEFRYLFTGLLRCPDCGATLVYKIRDKGYKCSNSQNGKGCATHFIKEEIIIAAVKDTFKKIQFNYSQVKSRITINCINSHSLNGIEKYIIESNKKICDNINKQSILYEDYKEDLLTKTVYKLKISELQKEIEILEINISKLETQKSKVEQMDNIVTKKIDSITELNYINNKLLKMLINCIKVYKDGSFEIIYKLTSGSLKICS